jgi:hypothetical protein
MSESDGSLRRYSDDEVGRILERAADLESHGAPSATQSGGMSLAELEEIGVEAGLDAGLLRQAAHELEMGIEPRASGRFGALFGAPLEMELEREVIGELGEEGFERLVPMIQMAADGLGHASVIGRTLTWQSTDVQKQRALNIAVTSRDGRTRISIGEKYGTLAGGLFGGIVGGVGGGMGFGVGMGVGLGALGSVLFATLFPIGAIGGSYLLARTVFTATVTNRRRILSELLERVAAEVETVAADQLEGQQRPQIPDSTG